MPRGTLEVILISAKGLDDNDFLCKQALSLCSADKKNQTLFLPMISSS